MEYVFSNSYDYCSYNKGGLNTALFFGFADISYIAIIGTTIYGTQRGCFGKNSFINNVRTFFFF